MTRVTQQASKTTLKKKQLIVTFTSRNVTNPIPSQNKKSTDGKTPLLISLMCVLNRIFEGFVPFKYMFLLSNAFVQT